jgi:hypothetical protein
MGAGICPILNVDPKLGVVCGGDSFDRALFAATHSQVHRMEQTAPEAISGPIALPAADGIKIAQVPFDAPWAWLAAGWRDIWSAPGISLLYGAAFAVLSMALVLGLLAGGLASLTLALAGGFLLIGPAAAVGLYEMSRRLEIGRSLRLGEVLTCGIRAAGQLGFFGAILAFSISSGCRRPSCCSCYSSAVSRCRRRASSWRRCSSPTTASVCW